MKKYLHGFVLSLISFSLHGQAVSLVSMSPNSGSQGQTITATITATGTQFVNSSPQGNVNNVYLFYGSYIINADYNSLAVIDNEHFTVDFPIPGNALAGSYTLHVDQVDPIMQWIIYSMTLNSAFTIGSPDGYAAGVVFNDANSNGIKDGGETGIPNEPVYIQPYNIYVPTDAGGAYSFGVPNGSYTVNWAGNPAVDYFFNTTPSSFNVTVNNNTITNDIGLERALVSMSPNTAMSGTTLSTTITADRGVFLINSSAQGNINGIYLKYGSTSILGDFSSINVLDSLHATVNFNLPANTPPGSYDLEVFLGSLYAGCHKLLNAFTVSAAPSNISGTIFYDTNGNGVYDSGEATIPNQPLVLQPNSITTLSDAGGIYNFNVLNGNYTINWVGYPYSDYFFPTTNTTFSVSVNNNTVTNDVGLKRTLVSISPNASMPGYIISTTISADQGIFLTNSSSQGNINSIYLRYAGSTIFSAYSSINILDSAHVMADFYIPGNATPGLYDLYVQTDLPYQGSHRLLNAFNITVAPSNIEGIVYYDTNGNGIQDIGEPGMQNRKVFVTPDSLMVFTDNAGHYAAGVLDGTHTVALIPDTNFNLTSLNSSYTVTVNNSTSSGNDFGLQAVSPNYSVYLSVYGTTHCAIPGDYHLAYSNYSSIPFNGVVYFIPDSAMSFLSSVPPPDGTSGDTLFWNVSNVQPFTAHYIDLQFNTPVGGIPIAFYGQVNVMNGLNVVYSVTDVYGATVNCSLDPNEKTVFPVGIGPQHFTLVTDTLVYTLHFQNTGTDTAYTVTLLDELDHDLEWNTFQFIGSSHPVITELNLSSGLLKFTFNNILLPDSATNEPASNGYVIYSIMPKPGLPDYTQILNLCNNYFDGNSPVATNITLNTLMHSLPVGIPSLTGKENPRSLVIPNPFNSEAMLVFDNPGKKEYHLSIYNLTAEKVFDADLRTNSITIRRDGLGAGIYFYRLSPVDGGSVIAGKFVIE